MLFRSAVTLIKQIWKSYVLARYGERRHEERRMSSDRLLVTTPQVELATLYGEALTLYRQGSLDEADRAFDRVLKKFPNDGPSKLMKSRIDHYKDEYAEAGKAFNPVYKFDEK